MESRSLIDGREQGYLNFERSDSPRLGFVKIGKGFRINEAGRVRWTSPGFVARGARLSGRHSSSGWARQRLALEVFSDPVRAGASKNQAARRLSLRLRLKPAVSG